MRFIIQPDGTCLKTSGNIKPYLDAVAGAVAVSKQEDLKYVGMDTLVAIYNRAATEPDSHAKPVKRFSDRATAEKRVWPVIDYLAREAPAPEPTTEVSNDNTTNEDTTMSTATKKSRTRAAKKTTATKKTSAAKTGEKRVGRVSQFAGKKLYKTGKETTRREGSIGRAGAYDLITNGMTYDTFIAKGGIAKHLAWDVEHGFIEAR